MVVPTDNPCTTGSAGDETDHCDTVQWLGPSLQLLLDYIITVDHQGIIQHLEPAESFLSARRCHCTSALIEFVDAPHRVVKLDFRTGFLCPGMIDLHIHAPQYAFTGTVTDRPLMGPDGWLETYTFPAEYRLSTDLDLAKHVYDSVVQTTVRHGTTTAVYFATLHLEPCQVLVDCVIQQGQRALVGKVCMDRHAPDHYIQSVEQNVLETQELIQYIHERVGQRHKRVPSSLAASDHPALITTLPLVLPLVTPRFIPTCTPQLLTALGEIAARYDCHVTTHISESHDEVAFSQYLDTFVDNPREKGNTDVENVSLRSDADILDSHNLLTDQCILAHGVHLSDLDCDLLRLRGSAVAHCPLSNVFFAGAILPCQHLCQRGNRVGLGTDVAGGYSPSMFHSSRMAVIASHVLQQQTDNERRNNQQMPLSPPPQQLLDGDGDGDGLVRDRDSHVMDYRHAFYLATLGGAKALGLHHSIGTLAVGMEFDALVLDAAGGGESQSPVQVFATDSIADIFQKICVLGDDRNVTQVFVQGRRIKPA